MLPKLAALHMSPYGRFCSLIPSFDVKLSAIILAGLTVLSAVGACPPHDGVRRRWWINVAGAVSLIESSQKSGDLTTAIVPAGTSFPAVLRESLMVWPQREDNGDDRCRLL